MDHKFHVGQQVICIKSHSKGIVKKGQIKEIQAIKKGPCKCAPIVIDVGIPGNAPIGELVLVCHPCNLSQQSDAVWWVNAALFAPLPDEQELSDVTVDEILDLMNESTKATI